MRQANDVTSSTQLRLVHTSDIHLGTGRSGPEAMDALTAVADTVRDLRADMLLIVGDLFDHPRVPDGLLEFFTRQVDRLSVPVVVLPGNHDCYGDDSVYRRGPFLGPPENLHVISSLEGETIAFPHLGLRVWGRAMVQHSPSFRPLDGMPDHASEGWYVAMAHGHFHYEYDRDERSAPILPQEVLAAECDYLALGHWDRYVDVSQGGAKAFYSGTPTMWMSGGPGGGVAVVELDPERGVRVRRALLNGREEDAPAPAGRGME